MQVNDFTVSSPEVGKIDHISIGYDTRKPAPKPGMFSKAGWNCEWVRVVDTSCGTVYEFQCGVQVQSKTPRAELTPTSVLVGYRLYVLRMRCFQSNVSCYGWLSRFGCRR